MDIRTICSDRKKIADRDIENIYEFCSHFLSRFGSSIVNFHSQNDEYGIGTHIYLNNGIHLFFGLNPDIENLAKDDKTKGKPAEFKENAIDYALGFAVQNEDFTGCSKKCIYIDSTLVNHEKWSFFKLPSVTPDSDISLLDMPALARKCVSMLKKYRILDEKKDKKKGSGIGEKIVYYVVTGLLFAGKAVIDFFAKQGTAKINCIGDIILLAVIICYTVYVIKSDSHRFRSNKLDSLRETYDKLSEKLHSEKYTDKTLTKTTTDASGKSETTKEYYPSGKAAVDLYKAYSSAVVDV